MAIEFVGQNTRTGSGTISLTALTGGLGSAALEGDLVVVIVGARNSTNLDLAISTPSGYSEWVDFYDTHGSGLVKDSNFGVFYKRQGSTPDTSVTIPSHTAVLATAYVLRGVDASTPLDASVVTSSGVLSVPNNPSVTTVTDGAMVLAIAFRGTGENTTTAPTGYSNLSKIVDATNLNWICVANKLVATAGNENPPVWQNATDGSLVPYAVATIALRPAASSGGNIKVWNGSAWVAKPVKVWDGSAWVVKPVKRWNGSAWITTPY